MERRLEMKAGLRTFLTLAAAFALALFGLLLATLPARSAKP